MTIDTTAIHEAIAKALSAAATPAGRAQIEAVNIHTAGYVEPGYSHDGAVATGNWNTVTRYDDEKRVFETIDEAPAQLGNALEALGVDLQWEDEWEACGTCAKLVRTSADSYGWQRSYVQDEDGTITCIACIDPAEHLADLENKPGHCNTLRTIDPAQHGYVRLDGQFENGYYDGQADDPKTIAETLRTLGVTRFLFNLDNTGQFDVAFSLYVHKSITKKKRLAITKALQDPANVRTKGLSPAEALKTALSSLPPIGSEPHGIQYHEVQGDGSVKSRTLTPEEFVRGVKRS